MIEAIVTVLNDRQDQLNIMINNVIFLTQQPIALFT